MKGAGWSSVALPLSRLTPWGTFPHPEPGLPDLGKKMRNSGEPEFRGGGFE